MTPAILRGRTGALIVLGYDESVVWARHIREGLSQLAESTIADP